MASKIAFCTTCKNRTNHLEMTLRKNLEDNKNYEQCKFVIIDYNSQDHLRKFLKENFQKEISDGKVIVYSYCENVTFHMAHAKNMSHRCGILEGGEILVNLDADGYSGEGFAEYIDNKFSNIGHKMFMQAIWNRWVEYEDGRKEFLAEEPNGKMGPPVPKGSNGRMVVSKNAFLLAGGYDEKYATWSADDKDFNIRLRRLGYSPSLLEREFQNTVLHNDKIRFKEYPHASVLKNSSEFRITVYDSNETVANFGNIGCGIVYKNFNLNEPITINPLPTRIFGIGLHKTATMSLNSALKILGYNSAHWLDAHWAKAIWTEMTETGKSPTLERHYALCDLPISILYEQLDKAYPGSKFILTIRNEEKWLESARKHWDKNLNEFRKQWDNDPFSHFIHKVIYGRRDFQAEIFLERYRKHNHDVREYFKGRKDLLILNMGKDDVWTPLCKFLDKPVPSMPYPNKNWSNTKSEE